MSTTVTNCLQIFSVGKSLAGYILVQSNLRKTGELNWKSAVEPVANSGSTIKRGMCGGSLFQVTDVLTAVTTDRHGRSSTKYYKAQLTYFHINLLLIKMQHRIDKVVQPQRKK